MRALTMRCYRFVSEAHHERPWAPCCLVRCQLCLAPHVYGQVVVVDAQPAGPEKQGATHSRSGRWRRAGHGLAICAGTNSAYRCTSSKF